MLKRRQFLVNSFVASAATCLGWRFGYSASGRGMTANGQLGLDISHFPSRGYLFIWRNWFLVPANRIAAVIGSSVADVEKFGDLLGLPRDVQIDESNFGRSYVTIIRANWHVLPEEQLLVLLNWEKKKFDHTLKEDDFLDVKLGKKPACQLITWRDFDENTAHFRSVLASEFPDGLDSLRGRLFGFVNDLAAPLNNKKQIPPSEFSPRFGYSYFAVFGDPLLGNSEELFPDGYLERMASSGMDGTWLHIVLSQITPFPWGKTQDNDWKIRLANLKTLAEHCKRKGIGIYLYLNEPRRMPLSFFDEYPQYKGVVSGGLAALCTSHPDVQDYIVASIAHIVEAVPELAGFFSITASENETHCWSHGGGSECPRCAPKGPEVVIAELNQLFQQGIDRGFSKARNVGKSKPKPQLIIYDWAWKQPWIEKVIPLLPKGAALMSVSEWGLPIERGGIESIVGEYSISSVGPSKQALGRWRLAKQYGLRTIAKIQAGNSWEIAAVPYIPAVANVAKHVWNLKQEGVDGLMLGWSHGGYPSPNLEVASAIGANGGVSPDEAMERVALRRYKEAGEAVVKAWKGFSQAFSNFPFHLGVIYNAPLHVGPANLLWQKPTGFKATLVGICYDDLNAWRTIYPVSVFIHQLRVVSEGFDHVLRLLREETANLVLDSEAKDNLESECRMAEVVRIHFDSVANQSRIVTLRDLLLSGDVKAESDRRESCAEIRQLLADEIALTKRLLELQIADSRIGFEASNHYFYVPSDLVEKVLNCRHLLKNWLPIIEKG